FSTSSFDTELPPDARAELLRPKRPVILEHPPVYEPPDRSSILKLAGSVLVVAILLVAVLTNRQPQKQQSAPAAQPTPAPSMQPVPTPAHPAIQPPVQQTRPLPPCLA